MLQPFIFHETSPAAAGVALSSNPVSSAANYLPAGVAGPVDDSFGIQITVVVGNPVGGSLDIVVQSSPDDGLHWFDQIHFTAFASGTGGAQVATLSAISQPASAVPVSVGTGTPTSATSGLAAGTVVQGMGYNRLRLAMIAGTGTTAGVPVTMYVAAQRNDTRA